MSKRTTEFAYGAAGALLAGATLGALAHWAGPKVAAHPVVVEGRKRADRAVHVLRGHPIMYRLRVEDGTVYIDDDHARIDTVTVIGGPPRVAMTEVEDILADALDRARAAVHQPHAIHIDGRSVPWLSAR